MSVPLPLAEVAVWWVTSRAAGVVALVAASASVALGLAMAGRLLPPRPGRADALRTVHEALGVATFAALAVHALALLADPWLAPGILGVLVPFTMEYRPLATGIGILAGYALVVLGATAWIRHRPSAARRRLLHRFTGLAWAMSVAHTITAGTDAGAVWMIALLVACVLPVLGLLARRVDAPARTARPAPQAA